jgi:class 3 adenylate cyclase
VTAAWVTAVILAAGGGALVTYLFRRTAQLDRLLADSKAQLERLQRSFERFVPGDVVDRLTDAHDDFPPQRRHVTMLFADLRDFTALCDRLDPAQSVAITNGYFERMGAAIANHHGHLTEVVGDGLLALFGAVEPNPWQARDAVLASLAMRDALAGYNAELRARALPELSFGVGIHGGEVVCGVMGAGAIRKFGVAGDPINVASRIEGLTREHGVDLLVSEDIRAVLDAGFRLQPMPPVFVRGKPAPVLTYFVEGVRS